MGTEMNIGDFAAQTGLSVSAVRFYGDRGLLQPARVDPVTGYRLYTGAQVAAGSLIRDLRRINMPLADIERALTLPADERQALVDNHLQSLKEELRRVTTIVESFGGDGGSDAKTDTEKTPMPETTLSADDIATALDQVLPAAGADRSRPDLMTVLIEATDGSLRFVATDSHRCVVRDVVPAAQDGTFAAVVSAKTMAEWRAGLTGQTAVALQLDGAALTATGDGIDLRAPLLQITFPPYEDVLASAARTATTIVATKVDLLDALEAFDGDGPVKLDASSDSVSLADRSETRSIAASCDQSTSVALNPRFAADAVRHAVGPEVVIEIDGQLDPLVFRSADDGTYTSLVMPIKLDD